MKEVPTVGWRQPSDERLAVADRRLAEAVGGGESPLGARFPSSHEPKFSLHKKDTSRKYK